MRKAGSPNSAAIRLPHRTVWSKVRSQGELWSGAPSTFSYRVILNPVTYSGHWCSVYGACSTIKVTRDAIAQAGGTSCKNLPQNVALVDRLPHSQDPENSFWHAMRDGTNPNETASTAAAAYNNYIAKQEGSCTCSGLARAIHAIEDSHAAGHKDLPTVDKGWPSRVTCITMRIQMRRIAPSRGSGGCRTRNSRS